MTNTDDLNERCDDVYCIICGLPLAADHAVIPPAPFVDNTVLGLWEDDE